jgi:hypothetical protein
MINIKKNQVFESDTGNRVRVVGKARGYVNIANLDDNNRSISKTRRWVLNDSIRRRYSLVA